MAVDILRGRGVGAGVRWVFGYGSLMWRPNFAYEARVHGQLDGFARAFCIYSVHHRGTPERPGLVLGLAPGAGVRGVAYRVAEADWAQTYAYLLDREQPTETYVEAVASVRLDDGRTVRALAELIAGASGLSGRNVDYLRELVGHLQAAGEADAGMVSLLARVEAREGPSVRA